VSGYGLGAGHPERHLIALRDELARRGVRCELEDLGVWPRLRIHCPSEGASAEFDNNVVAAPIAGRWFFFWPGAEPIGSVTRLAQAAERIADDLGLDGDPDDDGTGQPVASLAVWRTLRRAGAGISSPVRPDLVPGSRGWRSGPRPEPAPGPPGPIQAGASGQPARTVGAGAKDAAARGMATHSAVIPGFVLRHFAQSHHPLRAHQHAAAGRGEARLLMPRREPAGQSERTGTLPSLTLYRLLREARNEITTGRISLLAPANPTPAHHQRDPRQHVLPEPSAPVTPAAASGHPARSHLQAGTR
jgi:hypothetical protein